MALGKGGAAAAYEQNISALAIAAQLFDAKLTWGTTVISVVLNIFAVMTAFFGVYLGFREAAQGLIMNALLRYMSTEKINVCWVRRGTILFAILLAWGAILLNIPILLFTSISSPIFGLIGCLIPAWLVYKVPILNKYKGPSLIIIITTGVLLCISPILAFL